MKLVCTHHFIVIEEEKKILIDNSDITVDGVIGIVEINTQNQGDAISVILTLIAMILGWTKANESVIGVMNGDTTITLSEDRTIH
jgi:hypothetical protein